MSLIYVWIIAVCLLSILEMLTGGFALLAFAVGALGSVAVAALGLDINWQIGVFAVVSLLFFFFIRPLMLKWWKQREANLPQTNSAALIGRTAKVVETISVEAHTGRATIDGDNFMARPEDESEVIAEGSFVEVVALDSTILIVKNK